MLDVLLLATMFLVCSGIGLPIAELVPASLAGRRLLAPALGLAVLAVAVPVGYRIGLSIFALMIASLAIAVGGWVWGGLRLAARGVPDGEGRIAALVVAGWLGAVLVMMLPRWVGGDQFSVFQGNHWDAFGYLESAVVYARRSYAVVAAASDAEMAKNPLYPLAQHQLGERPSVHLLYAMFSWVAPAQGYRLYYPFLVGALSQLVLVGAVVLRAVLPRARPAAWIAAAAVAPIGFWGQYAFDINAWSQVASAPLLVLLTGLVLLAALAPPPPGEDVRLAGALAIVVAGAIYLYPEGLAIYLAALGPFAIAVPIARMLRARRFAPRQLVPLAGIAGLFAAAAYRPLVGFLIKQLSWGSGNKVWWWTYFQAFFYGRDGTADNPIDFAAGLFGLYFATPAAGAAPALAAIQRAAIAVVIAGLLAALAAVRVRDVGRDSRALLTGWCALAVLLVVPGAVLACKGNYWAAGKAVSYAAPVFMMLLAAPIGVAFERPALRTLRWIAVVFVAFQLATGLARISGARDPDGLHYAPPYPSANGAQFKRDLGWDLTGLDDHLTANQTVLIRAMDRFAEAYLMIYLFTHHHRFATSTPVYAAPFGNGVEVGHTPPIASPDVEIGAEAKALVLHYADGRPDVRVPSRRD